MVRSIQARYDSLTYPVDLTSELRDHLRSPDDIRKENLKKQVLREHLTKLGLLEDFSQIEGEIRRDTGQVLGLSMISVIEWAAKKLDERFELVQTR